MKTPSLARVLNLLSKAYYVQNDCQKLHKWRCWLFESTVYGIVLTEQSCPCVFLNPNGSLVETTIITTTMKTASSSGHSTLLCHCFGFIKQDNGKGIYSGVGLNTFIYLTKYSTLSLEYDHFSSKNYNNHMIWKGLWHVVSYIFVCLFVGVLIYIFMSVFVYISGITLRGIGIRRTTGSSGHLSSPTSSRECACASGNDPIRFLRPEERREISRRLSAAFNIRGKVRSSGGRSTKQSVRRIRPTIQPANQPSGIHRIIEVRQFEAAGLHPLPVYIGAPAAYNKIARAAPIDRTDDTAIDALTLLVLQGPAASVVCRLRGLSL